MSGTKTTSKSQAKSKLRKLPSVAKNDDGLAKVNGQGDVSKEGNDRRDKVAIDKENRQRVVGSAPSLPAAAAHDQLSLYQDSAYVKDVRAHYGHSVPRLMKAVVPNCIRSQEKDVTMTTKEIGHLTLDDNNSSKARVGNSENKHKKKTKSKEKKLFKRMRKYFFIKSEKSGNQTTNALANGKEANSKTNTTSNPSDANNTRNNSTNKTHSKHRQKVSDTIAIPKKKSSQSPVQSLDSNEEVVSCDQEEEERRGGRSGESSSEPSLLRRIFFTSPLAADATKKQSPKKSTTSSGPERKKSQQEAAGAPSGHVESTTDKIKRFSASCFSRFRTRIVQSAPTLVDLNSMSDFEIRKILSNTEVEQEPPIDGQYKTLLWEDGDRHISVRDLLESGTSGLNSCDDPPSKQKAKKQSQHWRQHKLGFYSHEELFDSDDSPFTSPIFSRRMSYSDSNEDLSEVCCEEEEGCYCKHCSRHGDDNDLASGLFVYTKKPRLVTKDGRMIVHPWEWSFTESAV